jgi:hypothetical protein
MDVLARPETISLKNYKNQAKVEIEFQNLISEVQKSKSKEDKINTLQNYSSRISKLLDLKSFTHNKNEGYQRNRIAQDNSGWEILLIIWGKGDKTSIHGHPELCCYNYLKGEFKLEIFDKITSTEAKLSKEIMIVENSVFADCGESNTYCNHIHRIECLSESGFTLHIYSDDASKGDEFIEV